MLNEYLVSPPTAEQIAADPSGMRIPDLEAHLCEVSEEIVMAARIQPSRQDRFLSYAHRLPDPWRTRLTLDLLALNQNQPEVIPRNRRRRVS